MNTVGNITKHYKSMIDVNEVQIQLLLASFIDNR